MTTLWNDSRYNCRQLRTHPGFTLAAVLTLALGIGANLALFGILNELLLRPRPVAHPDELWALQPADEARQPTYGSTCRPYYDAIREHRGPFKSVIGYASIAPRLRIEDGVERVQAELVSGDYFSFLGVAPALGRAFVPEEDANAGTHSVAVISHAFWQSQFGGAPDVLGKTVTLNDRVVEVIGVAPAGFAGLGVAQPSFWMPASMEQLMDEFAVYSLVGRLEDPKLAAAAEDLISPIAAQVTKDLAGFTDPRWAKYGYCPGFQGVRVEPVGRGLLSAMFNRQQVMGFVHFGSVATVLLLLVACANVASLFLARAVRRRKEMATRLALGATRGALIRQLVGEGILVAALGTAGALLAFSWIAGVVTNLAAWWRGPSLRPALDWRVALCAAGCTLAVGVLFSLVPALQATRFSLFTAIKDVEGGALSHGRAWLRHGLIVGQIVGSLMLLCGAALCLRSMNRQLSTDVGFRTERLAVAPLNLERAGFTKETAVPQLAEIVRRVSLVPGVKQVGLSWSEPLDGSQAGTELPEGGSYNFADVGPNTFAALGVPVLRGREIDFADLELKRKVVVVNETFARKFWPNEDALGRQVADCEVIGVVKDVRFSRFDAPPGPTMFRRIWPGNLLTTKLLIQADGNSRHLIGGIRSELLRIHPRLLGGEICALHDTMRNALGVQGTVLQILGVLGGLALMLAMIGTYGVTAYVTAQRTREIGIRVSLGATGGAVIRLVLCGGLRLGLVSLVIGIPLTLVAAGLLRNQLVGISPFDPVSFLAVGACVLATVLAACWLPARRAARIDPMASLRSE
jgi:predicted permease